MPLNIPFLICGFAIIILLAWSSSIASDIQKLIHRVIRLLFFTVLIFAPMLSTAQWQAGKYQAIDTLYCDDPEKDECYFSIASGNSDGFFAVTPCSGIVKVDTAVYASFARSRTFTIAFAASDPQRNIRKKVYKIKLIKNASGIKQRPIITPVS